MKDGTAQVIPRKYRREYIPLEGRIVALADTFDALTSRRPYKDPYPVDVAYDIIKQERGKQFDPDIVDIFINNYNKIIKIKEEVNLSDQGTAEIFIRSERDNKTGINE
jgi:putative two-component system response regulator